MDRRSFLKALVAVGVSAAVAGELVEQALSPTSVSRNGALLFDDWFALDLIAIHGAETESRMGMFELARGDVPLMRFAMNTMNYLDWIASPGESILVRRSDPIMVNANFDGAVRFSGHGESGYEYHSFALRRDGRVIGGRICNARAAVTSSPATEDGK